MVDDKVLSAKDARIGVFIQARMGSTRLPGKCMKPLAGTPIVDWVIQGVQQSARIDGILVCIPDTEADKALQQHLESKNVEVFAGSEDDVLGRYCEAAKAHSYSHIIRVTADCPLVSGPQLDTLIEYYFSEQVDYAFNHVPSEENFYPDGIGGELFSKELLLRVAAETQSLEHREHVTLFIRQNEKRFSIGGPRAAHDIRFPSVKLDVDTADDFTQIETLLSALTATTSTRPTDREVCEKYLELFT